MHGRSLDATLVCAFVVAEEVGLRGAHTAAYQIEPDLALALEGTIAADMPGIAAARQPTAQGKGPAITVADNTFIASRKVVAFLEDLAKGLSIPYQFKRPTYGGTDAGAIHMTRSGVLCGAVSVPCRYIHSPLSTLRLDDFENAVKLVTEFVVKAKELK